MKKKNEKQWITVIEKFDEASGEIIPDAELNNYYLINKIKQHVKEEKHWNEIKWAYIYRYSSQPRTIQTSIEFPDH